MTEQDREELRARCVEVSKRLRRDKAPPVSLPVEVAWLVPDAPLIAGPVIVSAINIGNTV